MSLVPSSPIPGTSTPEIIPGIWGFSHHFLLFSVPLNATIIYQTDTSQQALLTEGAEAKVLAAQMGPGTQKMSPPCPGTRDPISAAGPGSLLEVVGARACCVSSLCLRPLLWFHRPRE